MASQVSKANRRVGQIKRFFTYLDKDIMRQLFISFVRPFLEFGNVVWSPHYKKYIDLIEQVQRRATKCVPGLYNMTYEARLAELKYPSLRFRRKRGDLIEIYTVRVIKNENYLWYYYKRTRQLIRDLFSQN